MRVVCRSVAGCLLLSTVIVFTLSTPAAAATGSFSTATSASTAFQSYNTSTKGLSVQGGLGTADDNAGRCVDSLFDWISTGHHDARVMRNCDPGTTYWTQWNNGAHINSTTGAKKAGICMAESSANSANRIGCIDANGPALSVTTIAKCNSTAVACKRKLNGVYSSPGDWTNPDSP